MGSKLELNIRRVSNTARFDQNLDKNCKPGNTPMGIWYCMEKGAKIWNFGRSVLSQLDVKLRFEWNVEMKSYMPDSLPDIKISSEVLVFLP